MLINNIQRHATTIIYIYNPKTTAFIFISGKIVITSAKFKNNFKLAS